MIFNHRQAAPRGLYLYPFRTSLSKIQCLCVAFDCATRFVSIDPPKLKAIQTVASRIILKSYFSNHKVSSMQWSYLPNPDPELSLTWRKDLWPPRNWGDISDRAIGALGNLWEFDDPQACTKILSRFTQEQHMLLAITVLVNQVCNGGFSQAFVNSYGEMAEEALMGFDMFGLAPFGAIFDEAYNRFGIRPIPQDRYARIERLKLISNADINAAMAGLPARREGAVVIQATAHLWTDLENKFFDLLRDGTGKLACRDGLYRPLAAWIHNHQDRFFTA